MSDWPSLGPLLEPNEPPPGQFVDGRWQGERDWRTRHGPAIVQWMIGRPTWIRNAVAPDGARRDVTACSDTVSGAIDGSGIRKTFRTTINGAFIHGLIDLRPDDVTFTPLAEQPVLTVDPADQALFDAISGDAAIADELKKREMAFALDTLIMSSPTWTLVYNGHRIEFSPKYSAHFVAALRANGECFLDYYGRLPEGMTEEHVQVMRSHLLRLGVSLE